MAKANISAAIEASLHEAITKEAAKNKISFSDQVSRYRAMAYIKIQEHKVLLQ